jgi:hypothetical protein
MYRVLGALMNRARWILLSTASFWMAACAGSIMGEYESARDAALAAPGPVPAGWQPDIVLHLSPKQVDEIVTVVLEENGNYRDRFEKSVLGVTLTATPDLDLDDVKLGPSKACEGCVAVDAALSGDIAWSVAGRKGTVPVKAKAKMDAQFEAVDREGIFKVTAAPRDVRDLEIKLQNVDASVADALEKGVREWLREEFLKKVKPVELTELGAADMPLRAVTLKPQKDGGLAIGMLSRSPSPGALEIGEKDLAEGFLLELSQDSLLDLARASSFTAGAVGYDVVVDPTSLDIQGDAFTMGLRFWRPVGKGWWRDYTVNGTMETRRGGIKLAPSGVTEGEKSKGAAVVDPLAALAEGYILKTIEDSLATTLPGRQTTTAGGLKMVMKLQRVTGEPGVLVARGQIDVTPVASEGSGGRRR